MAIQLLILQLQIVIAVIVVLLLRSTVMRKLPKVYSYILWILVFVRILCPVTYETDFGIIPSREKSAEWVQQVLYEQGDTVSDVVHGQQDIGDEPDFNYEEDSTGKAEYKQGGKGVPTGDPYYGMRKEEFAPGSIGRIISAGFLILSVVWVSGTVLVLGCNAFALMQIRRYIRKAEFFEKNVYLCGGIASPFTLGLFHPRIYLPKGLNEEERDYIICHEQVHIHRKDYLVKNAAFLLAALYWFNPFVWIAFLFLERDMEMSCDERVILLMGEDIKRGYSQSLLNFAKGKAEGAMTPLTFGENNVKQRVKNVLSYKNAKKWSAIAGIMILAISGVILFTVQSKEDKRLADEEAQSMEEQSEATQPSEGDRHETRGKLAAYEPNTMERALDRWARAFIERDGYTLYELTSDKEQFMEWDYVDETEGGGFSFGYSSPWPWEGNYWIEFTAEDEAVIRYYMNTSPPEIYITDETVKLVQEGNLYYVNHEELTEYYSIESREQFEQLYGSEGSYDFGPGNTGYSTDFYRQILRNEMAKANTYDAYVEYTDPVAAAKHLLHLGPGEGVVTYTESMPISGTLYTLDSRAGEGSKAYVTYTFAKDNSVIEIPMELIEGSQGIWAPVGSALVRTVYESGEITDLYETQEGGESYIEISTYGIYILSQSGLTCVYPYNVSTDACWAVSDGKIYCEIDSQYQEGSLDYYSDAICVVDLDTDDFTRKGEIIEIPDEQRYVFPLRSISVEDGVLFLYGEETSYQMSLDG